MDAEQSYTRQHLAAAFDKAADRTNDDDERIEFHAAADILRSEFEFTERVYEWITELGSELVQELRKERL